MTTAAIHDLETLATTIGSSADPELKVALSRVAMEVNSRFQAGSASSASYMTSVIRTLKKLRGLAHADLRINCLIDASHFFYLIGQTFNAIEPAMDAVDLASKTKHRPLLRKSLTFLGIMYSDTGNISKAIECYASALEIAQELRDAEGECSVWVNLGASLFYAAQYRDAVACHEHVIQIAGNNPSLAKLRTAAFSNIALCCLHLEDFARGLKAAEICIKESGEPHSAAELVSRVLRENYYTRLLLEVDNLDKAGERCQIARRYAMQSKSARAEIASSIAEGLYEVQAGRIDVGISRLTSTLERARIIRSMLRDTLAALVKAYEVIGQPQRALMYLREMMEALRQTQQENALKHVKLHLEGLAEDVGADVSVNTRLSRQEAALQGKVAEEELFRSRI